MEHIILVPTSGVLSEAKPEWSVAVSPVSEMWHVRNLERVVVINYFNGK